MKKHFILVPLILFYSCKQHNQPLKTGFEGKSLPTLNLLLSDSITYLNIRDLQTSRPIVLFYFSPECPYCRSQLNEILKNIDLLKGIKFFMITNFPFVKMKLFYNEYKLYKYSNITIGYDFNYSFATYFNPQAVPYMAIYGKDNKLNSVYVGHLNGADIKNISSE